MLSPFEINNLYNYYKPIMGKIGEIIPLQYND